jgi:hypothetical protein
LGTSLAYVGGALSTTSCGAKHLSTNNFRYFQDDVEQNITSSTNSIPSRIFESNKVRKHRDEGYIVEKGDNLETKASFQFTD